MSSIIQNIQTRLLFKCQTYKLNRNPVINLTLTPPNLSLKDIEASPVLSDFFASPVNTNSPVDPILQGPLFISAILFNRVDESVYRDMCGDLIKHFLETIVQQLSLLSSSSLSAKSASICKELLGYWIKQGEYLELIYSQLHEDAINRVKTRIDAGDGEGDGEGEENDGSPINNLRKINSWSDSSLIDLMMSEEGKLSNFVNIALIQASLKYLAYKY